MRLWILARRELLGSSRRRLPYVLRIACLAVMAVWVYSQRTQLPPWTVRLYPLGRILFGGLMVGMWFFLGALAFFLPFGALSKEKETRTGELLLIAGLRPGEIVLGTFVGSLGLPILLLATSLPLAMAALALGGVSGTEVAAAYSGALALIVLVGSFGAVAGAAGSLILGFFLAGAYFLLPIGLLILLGSPLVPGFLTATWLLAYLMIPLGRSSSKWRVIAPLCTTAVLSALCLWAASVLVRPRFAVGPRVRGLLRRARLALVRLNDRLFRGTVIGERFARTVRQRWPLFWRELKRSLFTRLFFQLVLGGAVVAVWLAAFQLLVTVPGMRGRPWDAREAFEVMQGVLVVFFLAVPGALLARALVREKRSGALALMLAAPTSERSILGAHVASVLWSVWGLAAVLLLHEFFGAFLYSRLEGTGWAAVALASTSLVFSLGCGALCGVFWKSPVRALAAYVLILAAWLGGAASAEDMVREYGPSSMKGMCSLLSPYPALEGVLDYGEWGDVEDWAGQLFGCILGVFGLVFAARGMRARASR